jgi:hypothetical protein
MATDRAQHFDASLLSSADLGVAAGAGGRASGVAGGCVVGLVVGPGSDLSEEQAVQDVEPVTLDLESCLIVLPDPPHSLAVGWASAISER